MTLPLTSIPAWLSFCRLAAFKKNLMFCVTILKRGLYFIFHTSKLHLQKTQLRLSEINLQAAH